MKWMYALGLAAVLSGCPQSNPAAGAQARVLSSISQPNLAASCPVIRGDYIVLKGENLGVAADWQNGANKVIFFDNVVADNVELTQAANPGTLVLKVPIAAKDGPLVVEVGGVRSAPIEIKVAEVRLTQVIGECVYPPAPTR